MKKYFSYIIALAFTAFLFSCRNHNSSSYADLSVDEFEKKMIETEQPQLLDVRTTEEFEQGHIKGAVNYDINSDAFETNVASLDKTKPVFVYCLSGGRSSSAADYLVKHGFRQVYNMDGGFVKWNASGKPYETGNAPVEEGMSLNEFNATVNSDKLVLVDYNAKWCAPCKKMAPMLQKLAETNQDKLILVKIDADKNHELLQQKGIESLPTLELYKGGQIIWKHEGEVTEAELVKLIH